MSSFTDFLEQELLDHVFGSGVYVPPSGSHIALSTTTPVDAGTNFTEPGSGAYTRVNAANNKTTWSNAVQDTGSGTLSNIIAFTFPQATADWGTITHFGIYDVATTGAGNLIAWGALTTAKAVNNGDTAEFGTGNVIIRLS